MLRTMLELVLWSLLYGAERLTAPLAGVERLRRRETQPSQHPPSPNVVVPPPPLLRPPPLPATSLPEPELGHLADGPVPTFHANYLSDETEEEERAMSIDQDLSGDLVKVVQYSVVSVATDVTDTARVLCEPKMIAFADDMTAADFTAWILSMDGVKRCIDESITRSWLEKNSESAAKIRAELEIEKVERAIRLEDKIRERDDPKNEKKKNEIEQDLKRTAGAVLEDQLGRVRRNEEYRKSRFVNLLKNPKWHRVSFFVMSRFSPADIDWDEAQALYLSNIADEIRKLKHRPRPCE